MESSRILHLCPVQEERFLLVRIVIIAVVCFTSGLITSICLVNRSVKIVERRPVHLGDVANRSTIVLPEDKNSAKMRKTPVPQNIFIAVQRSEIEKGESTAKITVNKPVATPNNSNAQYASNEISVRGNAPIATGKFRFGRVAYLRCDGLQRGKNDDLCPRDTALESAVWKLFQSLTTCSVANVGFGFIDARLDFRRGQDTLLRILVPPVPGRRSLIRKNAVYECVGKPLTSLTTSLDPLFMIVSFQFEIIP